MLRSPKAKLNLEDPAVSVPGHGEVLMRLRACGICRGDLMVQNGDFPSEHPEDVYALNTIVC